MPSAIKEKMVTELTAELKESAHVVVTEYQGLSTEELNELRAELQPMGAKYKVVKNKLARIAFQNVGWKNLDDFMKGPTGIAFQGQDGSALARVLFKFSEKHTNLKIKAGHLFGGVANGQDVKSIATLPSKEVLLATLLARMQSPLQSLVGVLNEPLRSLHAALTAVAKKKEATPAA